MNGNEYNRAEMERARAVEASRDRLLARRLACIRRKLNRKPNALQRIWWQFVDVWALTWAVLVYWPTMFINLCLKKGWLVKVD